MSIDQESEVLLRTDLGELALQFGVRMTTLSRLHISKTTCPSCGGVLRCEINSETGRFRCLDCQQRGNALRFVELARKCSPAEALEYAAAQLDPPAPAGDQGP